MAKKPRSENYDALGSVFDFIFKEAEKRPERRKPIKLTGIAGDSELTNAIASALEMPGAFVSNTVIGEFDGALDFSIAKIQYGEFGKVEFKRSNLIDILKDPQAAFDKAIKTQKTVRGTQRAKFLGAAMDDFINTAWAHKFGNIEARAAMRGLAESNKVRRALGQYAGAQAEGPKSRWLNNKPSGKFAVTDLDFMAQRSLDLLGRETFGANWNTLSDADKVKFSELVSTGAKKSDIKNYLNGRHGATEANNFERAVKPVAKDINSPVDIFSDKVYKSFEERNLRRKIGDNTTSPQDRQIYRKTLYLLQRDRASLQSKIDRINHVLRTGTLTPVTRRQLKEDLKDTKGALRAIDGHTLFGRIGQMEGYLSSLNNVYGGVLGTNVIASVLNGDFYDKNKNTVFNPSTEKTVGGVKIIVPKELIDTKNGRKHTMINRYNKVGTTMYYATPRSLLRTFFYNGEGFAFLLNNKLEEIKNLPGFASLGVSPELLEKGFNHKNIDAFTSAFLSRASGILRPNEYLELQELVKKSKSLRKLTTNFSFISRVQARINQAFEKRLVGIRTFIANKILSNPRVLAWFAKTGAETLLKKWVVSGGVHVFAKSLVTAVVGALGLTMTPIVSAIVAALTWVAADFIMKAVGFGVNIFKWAALGIAGILVLVICGGFSTFTKFNKQTYSYRSETPGSIVQCSLYEEVDIEPGEDLPWGDPIIPPPSGEDCVLGSGGFWCSQGFKDVGTWSHKNMKERMPVDLTGVSYIYAPQFCDTGNCSITRIAKINCSDGKDAGGIVEYDANDGKTTYHFKLLHVQPLAALGEKLSGGQPVAVVQDGFEKGWCWTGKHLHLETTQNGSSVDPTQLLQSFSCNVPDESACARP